MKTKIQILTIILVFICLSFLSCDNSKNNDDELNLTEKEQVSEVADSVYKSKDIVNEKLECVNVPENSIVFFKVSDKEYKEMLKNTGSYIRYDYELLFRNFNHIAKSVKQITKEKRINVQISDAKIFQFITNDNDTVYFDRIKEDMILGQIFFTGKEKPKVESGLMKSRELKKIIQEYFDISEMEEIQQDTINNQDTIRIDTTKIMIEK